ncbi:hypothetical protein CkaCkLH20_06255 [Colletotrichum karsti]|uniref:Uncharacterized protein n=1 Tax=Colletotrichum karsti TaxID=1095194 RepID=A0A9P6I3L5_9PEZI|nr:uncharacterized protein CkaCkLH20_06255 [Colletotrichum karsti]KAF9876312.1 hypothetical protein CkaCkLH20_06255 [Colletotrichum karsti]
MNLVPRFKISKKGAPGSGRLLHTIYDSSRRETLIAESVVKKLRLPVFPWKPGNPIEVRSNKGLWLEITAYVTVHAEVPGLSDADLGQCNFGIMPDNIQGLEGVEIAVGARALEKLEEDCGLSPETRADIDLNYKGQKVLPMNSVLETGQPPAMFLGHGGHQQPSSLLQPPVYNPSFGFSNTSAFASGFSSNPASTPRTSLCESVRAQTTMYDCLNPLPPAIDQDNEEDWGNKSMISGGLQYGHHDNDNRSSISQAYSFSEQSLPGFNTQDTPGRPATTVSTTFGRRTPQVPSLTISPVMSFHGQRRYSVNGGYIQPEFSPTHSLMSHVSAATTGANFGPRLRPTSLGHLRSLSESQAEFGGLETTSSHWQLHMEDDLLGMDPNDIGMPVDPSIEPMDPDPFGPGFS